MAALLEVKNLRKSFGSRQAVNDVTFKVEEGDVFGLLGPNGAGKSTTFSIICGLLKANSGRVLVDGYDMAARRTEAKKLIGIVPQEPALYSQLSAKSNLRFWGQINGLSGRELEKAIDDVLTIVGLTDRAGGRIGKFSGGMKRRLNIAAGLIHNPKLLIMDEPTVGIDPQSRSHILETVKTLNQKGITVIYTSHYVEEVEALCNQVAIMDSGKIIAEGSIADLQKAGGQFQELSIDLSDYPEKVKSVVKTLPGVEDAFVASRRLKIVTSSAEQILPLVLDAINRQGATIGEIKIHKPNLESLFLKLTGKALRD